jgi:aryl-alcohol dehydrogenase-like predicted oxidoreductase
MRTRSFGRLWPVSALSLGGGGLGQVWGHTSHSEAVATLREAIEAGISLIDVAPSYGDDGEAERVVGEAFLGHLPDGVHVSTKHALGNPDPSEVLGRLERSLVESQRRMRLDYVDLFILHGSIVPRDDQGGAWQTPISLLPWVRSAFVRLVEQQRIRAWGITAVEVPSAVKEALSAEPPPDVVQCIANVYDASGTETLFKQPLRPREVVQVARQRGCGVMGIRAVQAGALTDALDRELSPDDPTARAYRNAAPFRALARELGEPPAGLAHRYALSMDGIDTVVLGVKNRNELRECLEAEARGLLSPQVLAKIDAIANRA